MRTLRTLGVATCIFLSSQNAFALGAVARACQFSTIPENLKGLAVTFFRAVGAPDSIRQLPGQPLSEQKKWWINEALTTDYFTVRYYLYAAADVYGLNNVPASTYYRHWVSHEAYTSQAWKANMIAEAMQRDPAFAIYYHNRGLVYSARAGDPRIAVQEDMAYFEGFVTLGRHWYYDPVNKVPGTLKDTSAMHCNLKDFGLENKGLFDW